MKVDVPKVRPQGALFSNLGHLAVDTLMDPSVFHNFDTSLRI